MSGPKKWLYRKYRDFRMYNWAVQLFYWIGWLFRKNESEDLVVLFGMGRSGSTLLVDLLNQNPELFFDGEILKKKIFHIYLVDVYAENIHKGLGGIPARRWEKSIAQGFSPRLPANPEELYILLGRVVYRRLHHYGIQFMNLRYNLLGLNYISTLRARLDGERVKVKYHPDDLSRIHIFDPFERQYIELPSLDPTYTRNLSLWKHREILREARKENKVDIASLGRAKRKINETVAIGRKTTKSTRRLYRARWNEPSKKASDAAPQDITNSSTKTNHDTQMDHLNSLLNNLSDNDWDTGPKLSDIK